MLTEQRLYIAHLHNAEALEVGVGPSVHDPQGVRVASMCFFKMLSASQDGGFGGQRGCSEGRIRTGDVTQCYGLLHEGDALRHVPLCGFRCGEVVHDHLGGQPK